MRRGLLAAVLVAASLSVVACGSGDDRECIKSHTEQRPPIYIKSGNVLVPVDQSVTVCDEYAPEPSGSAS